MKKVFIVNPGDERKAWESLGTFPVAVKNGIARELAKSTMQFERQVSIETPVGVSGQTRGAVYWRSIPTGGDEIEYHVGNPVSWAYPLEVGQDPHWAPKGALKLWAIRVLGVDESEADAVDYLIRRRIAGAALGGVGPGGTKGVHMFKNAWETVGPEIRDRMDGMAKEIARGHFK